jgi:hypothetical protein
MPRLLLTKLIYQENLQFLFVASNGFQKKTSWLHQLPELLNLLALLPDLLLANGKVKRWIPPGDGDMNLGIPSGND